MIRMPEGPSGVKVLRHTMHLIMPDNSYTRERVIDVTKWSLGYLRDKGKIPDDRSGQMRWKFFSKSDAFFLSFFSYVPSW